MKIENIKYSDFFINRKHFPPKGSDARRALRKQERDRCLGGVYVDGVHIPGWLYWHIDHWWITDDIKDEYGNITPWERVAPLRDNEWLRAEAVEKCKNHPDGQKGYCEVGLRQGAKSTCESSYIAYNATLFKKSQNAIISGSEEDLSNLKLRLNYGLSKIHDILKIPKLTKDKRSKEIALGYKSKEGEDQIWSYIIIRNISEGQHTEGPAGLSAKSLVFDEIGKAPWSQALEAAKPAMMSKYGWRAIPWAVGTGGSFDKGDDAERIFYHPEANNFLGFKNEETGEVTGFFMSGLFRTDCKYETNLAQYLIQEGKIPNGEYPELSKIPILVSDKVKALDKIKTDRALKALDPDQTEYLKLIMYFPLTPKECFLSTSENFYNKEIAEKQKEKLEQEFPGLKIGMWVDLEEAQEGTNVVIKHKETKLRPITSFPLKSTESTTTPVVILEHPIPNAPYALYVFGLDPYRHDKAPNSESLGALYIFKRAYDVLSDTFQDMPVAWLVGRPDKRSTFDSQARLLIKYYNAVGLCENDELSFIDYMISQNEGHYLLDTPDWIKALIPGSSTLVGDSRSKGVSSAAPKVKQLLRDNLKSYMEEVTAFAPQLGSTETRKILGISKINDPCFLDEIIKWNENGNFDREIAMSLAITAAKQFDKANIKPKMEEEDPRFIYNKKKTTRTPFPGMGTTLPGHKITINKLFKR